jgi:hypothetical protein
MRLRMTHAEDGLFTNSPVKLRCPFYSSPTLCLSLLDRIVDLALLVVVRLGINYRYGGNRNLVLLA